MNIIPFQFKSFQVRTVNIEGKPWFVAADVCAVLDHSNVSMALKRLDDDEKQVIDSATLNISEGRENQTLSTFGPQTIAIINESGLYSLVLTSRKPEAKPFRKWITAEVIPSIRKTGQYGTQQYYIPPDYASALRLAADVMDENVKLVAKIEADKPKVEFAEAVERLDGSSAIGDFAKVLGTGQNRLFKRLRESGYLMPNNMPFQKYLERGVFVVVEGIPFTDAQGREYPHYQTRITGKGQLELEKWYRRFRSDLSKAQQKFKAEIADALEQGDLFFEDDDD